jgi:hypothetical protein
MLTTAKVVVEVDCEIVVDGVVDCDVDGVVTVVVVVVGVVEPLEDVSVRVDVVPAEVVVVVLRLQAANPKARRIIKTNTSNRFIGGSFQAKI